MKTLITGVSSSIGIALSSRLLDAGHSVVGLDIRPPLAPPEGLDFIEANVRDIKALEFAAQGCDSGIHFAVSADQSQPTDVFDVNVVGAYNFLLTARKCGFSRSLIASSAPVHLPTAAVHADSPLPTSADGDHAYDLSKALQEAVARDFHAHGVPVMCLRLGHIVLGDRAMNLDEPIPLREMTYCRGGWVALEDVITACTQALKVSPSSEKLEILNIVGARIARARFGLDAVERRLNFRFEYDFAEYH